MHFPANVLSSAFSWIITSGLAEELCDQLFLGVMVGTLDSESSDPSSDLGGNFWGAARSGVLDKFWPGPHQHLDKHDRQDTLQILTDEIQAWAWNQSEKTLCSLNHSFNDSYFMNIEHGFLEPTIICLFLCANYYYADLLLSITENININMVMWLVCLSKWLCGPGWI